MSQWWKFAHVLSVFAFLVAHGVSVGVLYRLRRERDPRRVVGLLELSGASIMPFYVALGAIVVTGTVAAFIGNWWSQGWIWASLAVLLLTSVAMFQMARPYYRRVGLIARAMVSGSAAVTEEQFDGILRSRRPTWVAAIGFVGLVAILYFMMWKPTLGLGETRPEPPPGAEVSIGARNVAFDTDTLTGPAGRPFRLFFDNQESVVHNVSIYVDESRTDPLFVGEEIVGPRTITYEVPAIPPGTYYFVCDFHIPIMNGTFVAE